MPEKNKEKFLLKDALFNATKVQKLAEEIKEVYAPFDVAAFYNEVLTTFPRLELKARMYHIRDMFKKYLPDDFVEATTILLDSLPCELDNTKSDDDFGDFIYAPHSEYVVAYGCCDAHLDFSLNALREMTKRFSVEFSIRDFVNLYPKETLEMLAHCALSDNYHERRLASEGLRPKLPWAKKLTLDYAKACQHLEYLYTDNTRYVTRSVANHLNDISKIDAPFVLATLKRWKNSQKQDSKEMTYIINHALRTLVKKGDVEALALLGYAQNPALKMSTLSLSSHMLKAGEILVLTVSIEAKQACKLLVDYVVHYSTKRGSTSQKVYKLKKCALKKGERLTLVKKHPFKALMSTRTLYGGEHKVELQINGTIVEEKSFHLEVE